MVDLKCHTCQAELLPGTSYCRRCGSSISLELPNGSSELPTAKLHVSDAATTQRLQPRPTSPGMVAKSTPVNHKVFLAALIALCIVCVVAAITFVWLRSATSSIESQLMYPGAGKMLDMTGPDGTRTIHLQSSDSLDRVESWYQSNLKLAKTMKLTSNSYVMRSENANITLIVENDITNVLIKLSP